MDIDLDLYKSILNKINEYVIENEGASPVYILGSLDLVKDTILRNQKN